MQLKIGVLCYNYIMYFSLGCSQMKRGSNEWFQDWESKFSAEKKSTPKTRRLVRSDTSRVLDVQSQWEKEIKDWKGELEVQADQGDVAANKLLGSIELFETDSFGGNISLRSLKEAVEAASAADQKHPSPSYHQSEAPPSPEQSAPPSPNPKSPPARSQSMPSSPRQEREKPKRAASSTSAIFQNLKEGAEKRRENRSPNLLRKRAISRSRSSRSAPSTPPSTPQASRDNSFSESPPPEKDAYASNSPDYYKALEQMYDSQGMSKDDIRGVKIEHAKSIISSDGNHIDAIKEAYGETHDKEAAKQKILEIVIKENGPPLDNKSLDSVFKEFEPQPNNSLGM